MPQRVLKRYVFDAGNSNTGVSGLVIGVRAYTKRGAVRIANEFLKKYQYDPLVIGTDKRNEGLGVDYGIFCIGPNLTTEDIESVEPLNK